MQLPVTYAHIPGTADVSLQLRLTTLQSRDGRHGDNLAVSKGEVITGEDVSKEMRFKIIVGLGGKSVVERLSRESRLHGCSLLEGVIVLGERVGFTAGFSLFALGFTLLDNLLQCAKRIQ